MQCVIQSGYWGPGKTGRQLPVHTNPGLEMILVTKGEFEWEVEGRTEQIRPGTLFFTLPGQRHGAGERPHPGAELYFVVIAPARARSPFLLHRQLGLSAADNRWISGTLLKARRHAFPAPPLLRTLMPAAHRELDGTARGREAVATGLLRAAVVELARTVAANPRQQASRDTTTTVRHFIKELERRAAELWTLDTMSATCGLKRTQFAPRFAELTGDTPLTYLNRVRIRAAEELLATSGRSVTEIAFACGFQSSQYFSTVFRQFTGIRPSARRASN
jgi:AraC family L-rhamnose operon regulatory protein RhaS